MLPIILSPPRRKNTTRCGRPSGQPRWPAGGFARYSAFRFTVAAISGPGCGHESTKHEKHIQVVLFVFSPQEPDEFPPLAHPACNHENIENSG
jgi:hypothetical protein